jgi:hypothetical protein
MVTVPVDVKSPPTPEVGLRANVLIELPLTAIETVLVTPPPIAVIFSV